MNQKKENYKMSLMTYLLKRSYRRFITGDKSFHQMITYFEDGEDHIKVYHNGTANLGKMIYVIKENTGLDGFCATLKYIMSFLIYAEQHKFTPIIRLTEEFAYYDEEMSKKIDNPWEYYFLTDEKKFDLEHSLNVCFCEYIHRKLIAHKYHFNAYKVENYNNQDVYEVCSPVIRKYMTLKPEIVNDASNVLENIKQNGGKVLGVHFRGTDYKKSYNNHPVFVDENETIKEIKAAMELKEFDAVFVATDDILFADIVKKSLGDIPVLMHNDVYRSDGIESVAFSQSERKNHHYLLGYEIARDMYTLSLCDGLVACKSSVGYMSNLYKHSRNEQYEYMKIIDNGNNVNDNEYFKDSQTI